MKKYLLRIEAVNFDQFIGDTDRISVVRGASLALLFAPGGVKPADRSRLDILSKLSKEFSDRSAPEAVSTGASVGLYSLELKSDAEAADLLGKVRSWITQDDLLRHATFTVALVRATDNFKEDLARLIALGNWEQVTSSTLAWPQPAKEVCTFDGVRPASQHCMGSHASESVFQRYQEGRLYRQRLFSSVGVADLGGYPFTHSLSGLAAGVDSSLDGRIAVIYVDGNKFGTLLQAVEDRSDAVKHWDVTLRRLRAQLLRNLAKQFWTEPIRTKTQENDWFYIAHRSDESETLYRPEDEGLDCAPPIRFETLLWGGDEFRWVVPAWQAWRVLEFLAKEIRSWESPQGQRLTTAVGVAFCRAKAPIARINSISAFLGDEVKEVLAATGFNPFTGCSVHSRFAYHTFESFDHMGADLAKARAARRPSAACDMTIGLEKLADLRRTFDVLHRFIPRRRVHRIASMILARAPESDWQRQARMAVQLLVDAGQDGAIRKWMEGTHPLRDSDASELAPHGHAVGWVHLNELWDYIPNSMNDLLPHDSQLKVRAS